MPLIEAKTYKHLLTVIRDDVPVFDMPYQVIVNGLVWFADRIDVNGLRIEAHIGETLISDTIEPHGNFLCVTRRWSLRGSFDARVTFAVIKNMEPVRWIAPGTAAAAGGDLAETARGAGPIREEQLTIPGCSVLESADWTFGVFTQPGEAPEELCSSATYISAAHAELNISVPGVTPGKGGRGRKFEMTEWTVEGQVTYERRFYVWSRPLREGDRYAVLDAARETTGFDPAPPQDHSEIVRSRTRHLVENFFIERGDAVGFVDTVGTTMYPEKPILTGGGIGGNIDAARAAFRAGRATDDRYLKRIALDTADFFLSEKESGDKDAFDYNLPRRRWFRERGSQAGFREKGEFIRAAALLHIDAGKDANPRWLFTCKRMAEEMIGSLHAIENGAGDTSAPAPDESFLAAAFAELYRATNEKRYLETAEWLAGRMIALLHSDAFDQSLTRDRAHMMLRAMLLLFGYTNRAEYGAAATRTADIIESLTYSYNIVLPPGTPLAREAFHSDGGILPEPGALHLDPYPAALAFDFLNLWKLMKDDRRRRSAIRMIDFSAQMVTLNHNGPGMFFSFDGWQPARFYHTGDPDSVGGWGSVSRSAASWVPAVTINSLIDIHEQYPDVLALSFLPVEYDNSARKKLAQWALAAGCIVNLF